MAIDELELRAVSGPGGLESDFDRNYLQVSVS